MINAQDKKELIDFLDENPSPVIRKATTMYSGRVQCIKPVKTICGAEVMCHPSTMDEVRNLIRLHQCEAN